MNLLQPSRNRKELWTGVFNYDVIEKALHPHITSWGSLLRLYGSHSLKSVKEKKQEEQQITLLQSKAAVNAPNYAILDKLRMEMTKLKHVRVSSSTPISISMINTAYKFWINQQGN